MRSIKDISLENNAKRLHDRLVELFGEGKAQIAEGMMWLYCVCPTADGCLTGIDDYCEHGYPSIARETGFI